MSGLLEQLLGGISPAEMAIENREKKRVIAEMEKFSDSLGLAPEDQRVAEALAQKLVKTTVKWLDGAIEYGAVVRGNGLAARTRAIIDAACKMVAKNSEACHDASARQDEAIAKLKAEQGTPKEAVAAGA